MTATGDWVSVDRERILATAEGLQPTPEQMQGRCLLPTTAGTGFLTAEGLQGRKDSFEGCQERRPTTFPLLGLSITLITAEGIPVPWRNKLGVLQALHFIKCFYSITLQLQGVVSGGLHL